MNIYEKIQIVSQKIKNIEKNMTVGTGNYAYKAVSDLNVILPVKDAEAEVKLLSIPIKQELIKSEIVKVQKDKGGESIQYVDIVKMTVRIINIENPEEFIDIESFGRGLDPGDKGFGKASTYARKYAILNAYKIATGEDPDGKPSETQKPIETPSDKRVAVTNFLLSNQSAQNSTLERFNHTHVGELTDKEIEFLHDGLRKRGNL